MPGPDRRRTPEQLHGIPQTVDGRNIVSEPVVIEAAINGVTPKTVDPNVPVSQDEIVAP
jgi:hypothetical protein